MANKGIGAKVSLEYKEQSYYLNTPQTVSMLFRKIEDNVIIDHPVQLALNTDSVKSSPVMDLNENGDGLVIWADSYKPGGGESSIYPFIYARYIKNFEPQ